MTNKPTDTISSLAKGLRVLECFGAETPKLSITDTAKRTGLDRSTARRCLLTLHAEGYADYDGKFFTLTPRVLRLGLGAIASLPLPQLVQPWLDQLAEQIGESCSVSILDGTEIVYLARASQKRVMSIGLMPGSRLPAHCTSMGRVLLANMPRLEAQAIIGVESGWGRNCILSFSDHDFGHLYSPVSRICAHPSGEMCERSSCGLSRPASFRAATARPRWSVFQ